ncbi:translocation/assembly module TamB domain-containing protein [Lewinella sp. W8]|uniref:translocation/assembly module TamB domain-containing protein n=1 Tax=Lewinella sp. W8 TaxID=2528208 RepID=UPI0010674DF0|nr:translocation/assembly module TamB domain-containing protein [Lewinella sp. W8]MTB49958.1 hypothetical protein [Lewinella sp. W8]
MSQDKQVDKAVKKQRLKRRWSRGRKAFVWLITILAILVGASQLPIVQRMLADYVTHRLSNTLETTVKVDEVYISWLNELSLDGLFIEDKYGDTLLYSQHLEADFSFWGGLQINGILISGTQFKIRRDLGDPETNLKSALDRLFPPKEEKSNPLNLKLNRLDLRDISFVQSDSVRGQRFDVTLESGVIRLDDLDLPNGLIAIGKAELRRPIVRQTSISPNPLDSLLLVIDSTLVSQAEDTASLRFQAESFEIIDGSYILDNFRKDPIAAADITAVDFARLGTENVDLELIDASFEDYELRAALKHLSLEEKSGFVLDRLSVEDLKITPTELQLYDLKLVTAESSLSDSLHFRFRNGWDSWSDFNDEVRMDIKVQESEVAVRDILYFARNLRFNQFFRDNRNRTIRLGGNIRGRVNNLSARDVTLALDEQTYLAGEFSSRNLAKKGSEALNLKLDYLNTDMFTLRRLLTGFAPPPNFDRLGRLRFSGRFDGFFTDFAAKGNLVTDIGAAALDMSMDIGNGSANADYRGALQLSNFDLGAWTQNPDFGIVNFNGAIRNGSGLVAATATADLEAVIQDFTFRDYTYQNARIDGRLENRFFNGSFDIEDENIDFNFLGELDFQDSIPVFDFDATVGELDLQALNLSNRPITLSGKVDLNVINTVFSEMEGRVDLDSFRVLLDTVAIDIDSLLAYSVFDEEGQKIVKLESDIARGEVVGSFDLDDLTTSVTRYLRTYYPGWARRLNLKAPRNIPPPNRFSFDLTIIDSKGLNRLLAPKLGPLVDVQLIGSYDGFTDQLRAELLAPSFSFDNFEFRDLILRTKGEREEGELDILIDSTLVNGRPLLNQLTLLSLITQDTVQFGLTYGGEEDNILLSKVNLNGNLFLPDSTNFELSFDESLLVLFQEQWEIRPDNYITFGPQFIDTRNFALSSGNRRIRLNKRGRNGLNLDFINMNLGLIDSVWNYQPLDFSGEVDVYASVDDVFLLEGLNAEVRSDTFLMNGEDYGYLRMDLRTPNPRGQLTAFMNLNRDTAQLIAEATFNLADLVPNDPLPRQRKNYLDMSININGYPLELAKYWVGGSVSDIAGEFSARMNVVGPTKKLDVDGYIDATAGAFTIDYLQTRYRFYQSRVNIDNKLFDLTGTTLIDRLGNQASLSGGVTHDRLKNLGLNARIDTDRFLALELAPGENPNFYGRAVGNGSVFFTGDFRQPDIYVRATVGRDSRLSIPVDYGSEAGPIDNVRFVNRSIYTEEEPNTVAEEPTGVSLELELEVTEEAVGEIIFDEEVGDILRGQGNGDLTLRIPRDGDLQMFGTYTITEGDYLFTFYRVVNKEFTVRPGGTVTWEGNPFEARIDIRADYENLSTPILNFIQEYLITDANSNLTTLASQPTEVDLILELSGILTQPNISFDISFPELDGQLESYANNKRRLLLLDQNELNRQVFGLIVVGQFLPSDLSFNGSDVAVNTVSEWLSNYLSLLFNDLLKDAFGEDAFISSFEFDFAYNSYRNTGLDENTDGRSQAVEFSFRRDFNNRWTLRGDVNWLDNNLTPEGASGAFVGNDLIIEYVLNDARSLKLRFYQRFKPDVASSARLEIGTGLSWRREFDSLKELFRGLKEDVNENN